MSTKRAQSTGEADIRALLERWAKAVRDEDIDGIMAGHAPDVLMFDVPSPIQSQGLEAYRKTWDLFFSSFKGPGWFDLDEVTVTQGDSVAFATALIRCGVKTREPFLVRLTVGLRKAKGSWIITHEHHSVPSE